MTRASIAILLALSATALAGENGARKGPLAKLPSAPGPHVAKIKALGEGAWLDLGAPKPDPKWGPGRGRSWGCKMVYAADLGGAFHSGQGVHGYVKPDGYYDDIFFYDVNANTWICLYEGINTKTYAADIEKGNIKLGDEGYLVHKDGRPVYAWGAHSYQFQAYDVDTSTYICGGWAMGFGGDQHCRNSPWHAAGRKLLEEKNKGASGAGKRKRLWFAFDATSGKLSRTPLTGMFYLPGKKAFWAYGTRSGKARLRHVATGKLEELSPKGTGPLAGGFADFGACHDTKRNRIYMGSIAYGRRRKGAGAIYAYDVAANSWSNLPDKENAVDFPATNYGLVHYDTVSDRVVVMSSWNTGKSRSVSVLNPEDGTWEKPAPIPAGGAAGRGCVHGFYSPDVNAHFVYVAGDSSGRGNMWAYRYKRK
ncbi:MAG: Kelch repeat-containing protein [Planctomycetota bacterium]|jgi:hypothetical protein